MFNEVTEDMISCAKAKQEVGKKLNKDEKLLLRIADGEWHEASELAYNVSWRFDGYLHNLKERVEGVEDRVFRYRLCKMEE